MKAISNLIPIVCRKVVEGGIREENGIDLDRMNKAHDTKQNIYCVRF